MSQGSECSKEEEEVYLPSSRGRRDVRENVTSGETTPVKKIMKFSESDEDMELC